MEDFFKQFRKNLEQRAEPAFEERDWLDLQKHLDRADDKRPAGFAWWLLAIPALLILGTSNFLFYVKIQQANQKISLLETRKDTVFHTRVVYIKDTVYQIQVIRENQENGLYAGITAFPNSYSAQMRSGRELFPSDHQLQTTLPDPYRLEGRINTLDHTAQDTVITKKQAANENIKALPTIGLSPFPASLPVLPEIDVAPRDIQRKKTFRQLIHPVRPKTFQFGITGGWAFPFNKGLSGQKGYSAGIEAIIGFSPNLGIWVDAAYQNVRFETDEMDEAKGIPVVSPPSDAFIFVKAEVPQPSFQFSIGMQYIFQGKNLVKPYIGAGYSAVALLPYEVIYEFKDETLGIEWNYDKEIIRHKLLNNFLVFQGGLEYRLLKQWNAKIQANYRFNLGETGFFTPKMFGIQGGFYHSF